MKLVAAKRNHVVLLARAPRHGRLVHILRPPHAWEGLHDGSEAPMCTNEY